MTCTLSPFTDSASWVQDGIIRSTCTPLFCTDSTYENYTIFSFASSHIDVTFDPVDSSIDGEWKCTYGTLESASFNVTAMNTTQSK